MSEQDRRGDEEFMSPKEMAGWLREEIRDSQKAWELRVKDATAFVNAYAAGELSAKEANEKMLAYDRRWGEALFGASAGAGITDEAILKTIDAAREDSLKPTPFSESVRAKRVRTESDEPLR
jgi:hypothetical protein